MTEHLPECWAKFPSDPPAWCICDELRACERRLMTEVEESGHHDLCFISDPPSQECICERLKQAENYARIAVMHKVDVDSYEQGQRDAIAAAVQRIEALLFPWPNTWPGMIRRGDVITAIRGES